MDNLYKRFDGIIIDILKEIGNIGASNAATALAKLIDKRVNMDIPMVNVLDFSDVPEVLGGAEKEVVGTFLKIEGDIDGSIMFLLTKESSTELLNLLMPGVADDGLNEISLSALKEISNILTGAYISSLAELTKLNIKISVPSISCDMAGAILSVPAIHFGLFGDKILLIENKFSEIENGHSVNGFFILIPEVESYGTILRSLGVKI